MTRILGIDPGLQRTGWGVIDSRGNALAFVACGVVATNPSHAMAERLVTLHRGIGEIITRHHPDEAAVEETFLNRNPLSSLKLGHARGALLTTLSLAGLAITEYAATKVKKSVVGVGRAEKQQVGHMVRILLPGSAGFADAADAADALAVAICHAHHMGIRKVAGVQSSEFS